MTKAQWLSEFSSLEMLAVPSVGWYSCADLLCWADSSKEIGAVNSLTCPGAFGAISLRNNTAILQDEVNTAIVNIFMLTSIVIIGQILHERETSTKQNKKRGWCLNYFQIISKTFFYVDRGYLRSSSFLDARPSPRTSKTTKAKKISQDISIFKRHITKAPTQTLKSIFRTKPIPYLIN